MLSLTEEDKEKAPFQKFVFFNKDYFCIGQPAIEKAVELQAIIDYYPTTQRRLQKLVSIYKGTIQAKNEQLLSLSADFYTASCQTEAQKEQLENIANSCKVLTEERNRFQAYQNIMPLLQQRIVWSKGGLWKP